MANPRYVYKGYVIIWMKQATPLSPTLSPLFKQMAKSAHCTYVVQHMCVCSCCSQYWKSQKVRVYCTKLSPFHLFARSPGSAYEQREELMRRRAPRPQILMIKLSPAINRASVLHPIAPHAYGTAADL